MTTPPRCPLLTGLTQIKHVEIVCIIESPHLYLHLHLHIHMFKHNLQRPLIPQNIRTLFAPVPAISLILESDVEAPQQASEHKAHFQVCSLLADAIMAADLKRVEDFEVG